MVVRALQELLKREVDGVEGMTQTSQGVVCVNPAAFSLCCQILQLRQQLSSQDRSEVLDGQIASKVILHIVGDAEKCFAVVGGSIPADLQLGCVCICLLQFGNIPWIT